MFRISNPPSLSIILDGLFTHSDAALAKQLAVSVKTFKRWRLSDDAPRAARLALFYESKWGYSLLYTESFNRVTMLQQEVNSLRRENAALVARLARLMALGNFGASNAPLLKVF